MESDRDAGRSRVEPVWRLDREVFGRTLAEQPLWIRSGEPSDVSAVHEIEVLAHPTPWKREIFERESALEWSHLWVVEEKEGGRAVAFLVFWTIHDEVHILNVAVHPDARRRGIASELIRSLLEVAAKLDYAFITLEVRENNTPAIRLYESTGFEVTGRREEYYADTGEAALLMHRLI